ncbi:hypothetical protein AB0G86_23140 [Streptomyces scabiei]|uniref:hypothetical protein n=1 Tax=Streptomyces scabiei TaxID=1930 RepID=UPI0033FCC9F1
MHIAAGFWDGSGSALLGSLLSGVLAVGTFYGTRRHERNVAREQLAYEAAEAIGHALLVLEDALRPHSWETPRGDWRALWQSAGAFGHICIVRISALTEPSIFHAVKDFYNLLYEALRIMRDQDQNQQGPAAGVNVDVMLLDVVQHLQAVLNALLDWRNKEAARRPAVPDYPWRGLLPVGPPRMVYPDP